MVAPLIWLGWTAGATIAASLASCDGAKGTAKNDAGDTATMDDILSTDVASAAKDADAPPAKDTTTDAAPSSSQCPAFPLKGTVKVFTQAHCWKDGFISDIDDNGWGSCVNMGDQKYGNWLFHVGAKGVDQFYQTAGIPDQIVTGTQLFYSGQQEDHWGFGAWDTDPLTYALWTDLPTLSPGMPSFAKGIDLVGGKIFVASSNVSFATGSAEYKPGTVFAFDSSLNPVATITTSQVNPTSVGHFELGGVTVLAVVGSGPLDGKGAVSKLDIIDPDTLKITQTIALPFGGLGINGEIAIAGGRMAMGSADNSGRVVVLNTQDLAAPPLILTVTEALGKSGMHFISMTHLTPDGKYLVAGNYNTGKMSVWELGGASSNLVKQTIVLDDNLMDASGISDAACINGKLMVSVGNDIKAVE